jgi:multisubunit Na+/H+ antiporter MnhE subunit
VALRDWFVRNRELVTSIAAAAVWLGFSAGFGKISVLDGIVVAVLVGGGFLRGRTKRKNDDPQRGIYGPPQ